MADNKNNKAKAAQEKRDDQKVKDEKEDVKQAQDKLKGDQKELQDAQNALGEAEGREKIARQKLDEVRKRISAKAEKNSGIEKALAEQEAAKKAYDEVATPILKTLKDSKEHQAATKKVEDARARLKTVREDASLSDDGKRKATAQASQDALALSELESKTLEANPSAKSARTKLANVQDRVNQIRVKIRNEVEANSEISSSLQAMRSAADASEVAGQKVKRIRDKIAASQAKVAREQQQVKQAEAQDKANDNKNPPKNNKKK